MKLWILVIFAATFLEASVNAVCKAGIMNSEDAKKYINKFLQEQPNNIECILKLADVYLKSGEILKGYKYIARAYDVDPEEVKSSLVSNIYHQALDIVDLEKRAKQFNDESLWNKLGNNFFDIGVYNEAVYFYEKSMNIDKNQSEIGLKLALSYKNINKIPEALNTLKILIEQNEKNFYAHYYFGKILKYYADDNEMGFLYFEKAKALLEEMKFIIPLADYASFMSDINKELAQ